jgi:hypothetical protein
VSARRRGGSLARALREARGSAMVDVLFMFPVLFGTFLTFVEAAELEDASIATEHATNEAARAASVILADDPKEYDTPVGVAGGERSREILEAARFPLRVTTRQPKVTLTFPGGGTFRQGDMVRVKVDFELPCSIPVGKLVLCGASGIRHIVREAQMPYQGAGYTYP